MTNKELPENGFAKPGGADVTVLNAEITVDPEHRKEFFQTLIALSGKIRNERGCISYRLFEETGKENTLMLVAEWGSQADWEEHKKGENYAMVNGSVKVLGIRSKAINKVMKVVE
jgi:quinol monooxygenase YgiN